MIKKLMSHEGWAKHYLKTKKSKLNKLQMKQKCISGLVVTDHSQIHIQPKFN